MSMNDSQRSVIRSALDSYLQFLTDFVLMIKAMSLSTYMASSGKLRFKCLTIDTKDGAG